MGLRTWGGGGKIRAIGRKNNKKTISDGRPATVIQLSL